MQTLYYKVQIGYDRFISIDNELDLQKALYAFMEDKKVLLKNGAVDGKLIMSITEDWNKEMKWSPTYKLGDDDWSEIRTSGAERKYKGKLDEIKTYINHLISENKVDLIGKQLSSNFLIE